MNHGTGRSTLVVTNFIKLCGVAVALKAAFTDQNAGAFALAAFMMAGAQGAEGLALTFIERFFGSGQESRKE